MKKLLFLLVLLTMLGAISATTYLTEDFETAFVGSPAAPSGWTQTMNRPVMHATTEKDWLRNTWTGSAWTLTSTGSNPTGAYAGTGVLWIDDYNYNTSSIPQNSRRMESPALDLGTSTTPYIRFWYFNNQGVGVTLNLRLMVSANGGATWDLLTPIVNGFTTTNLSWNQISVAIPAAYRTSNFKFGFELTNRYGTANPFIDNVKVEDYTPTTIVSAATGDWNNVTTWVGGIIPTADNNVEIALGHTVTVTNATSSTGILARCQNLTVNGILTYGTGTANLLHAYGNILVNGTFNAFNGTSGRMVYCGGSFTINSGGIADFSAGTTAQSTGSTAISTGAAGIAWLGNQAASFNNAGTLNNGRIGNMLHLNPGGLTYNAAVTVPYTYGLYLGAVNPNGNLTLGNAATTAAQTIERANGTFTSEPIWGTVTTRSNYYYSPNWTPLTQVTLTTGYEIELIGEVRTVTGAFTMNTHNNLQLTYPLTLGTTAGSWTLTRGIVITDETNLVRTSLAHTSTGGTAPSTAIPPTTHGSYFAGPLRRDYAALGTTSRVFPLGVGTAFNGATPNANVLKSVTLAPGTAASQSPTLSIVGPPSGTANPPLSMVFTPRAYRVNLNGEADFPSTATLTLNGMNRSFGNSDNLTCAISQLRIAQATSLSGPWTEKSLTSGALTPILDNTTYPRTTGTTDPYLVAPFATNGEYFAWASSDPTVSPGAVNLTYPNDGATGLPLAGFNLTWTPNYTGGSPNYYVVYMSMNDEDLYNDVYFETTATSLNPATFAGGPSGPVTFGYNERWLWTVEAVKTGIGATVVDPPRQFTTILAPAQISINPGSFSQNMGFGQTVNQTLTINNPGGVPLNYRIGLRDTTPRGPIRVTPPSETIRTVSTAIDPLSLDTAPSSGTPVETSRAMFDLQFDYPNGVGGSHYSLASDGSFLYSSNWQSVAGSQVVHKYNLNGTFHSDLIITGTANGIRDLTYDGQYFYGTNNTTTIYIMDFNAQTTVGTIVSTGVNTIRGIAYDEEFDAFWTTYNWASPLKLIARDGSVLRTLNTTATSMGGLAYDNVSAAVPTLWANTQNGTSKNLLQQINLTTGAIIQTFDMVNVIPIPIDLVTPANTPGAGGLAIAKNIVAGTATLLGTVQNFSMWGLELAAYPTWVSAVPRTGTVAGGGSTQVSIQYNATATVPGAYSGVFSIYSNASNGTQVIPATVNITGVWPAAFAISPSTAWPFGSSELMNPITKQFIITNTGGSTLTLNPGDIYLTNNAVANFTVNATGLPVVLEHNDTYTFTVTFAPLSVGDKIATLNVQDNLARAINTVALSGAGIAEPICSVVNLQGTVQNTDVALSWAALYSTPGTPSYMHWDNGISTNAIGSSAASDYNAAVKFTTTEYGAYSGMNLTKIRFFPNAAATYTLKVWTGANGTLAPVTEVRSQAVTPTIGVWNEILLDVPYTVNGTDALYIGYNVVTTGSAYPIGCDSGPVAYNRGALIYSGGAWSNLSDLSSTLIYNWSIQGYFTADTREVAELQASYTHKAAPGVSAKESKIQFISSGISAANDNNTRVLRGYNVFRNTVQINPSLVTTNSYTDLNLAYNTYSYTVQAVYYSQNSAMSAPLVLTVVPPEPISVFPYTESFDGTTFAPLNWRNVNTAGTGTPGIWDRQTTGTNPTIALPFSGAGMIRYYCYNYAVVTKGELATPPINFPGNNYRVKFMMYRDNGYPTDADVVNVYYNTTNSSAGGTLLGTVNRIMGLAPVVATEGWYEYMFNMPAGSMGNGRYIIFEAVSAYGNNIFVDHVTIEQIPVTSLATPVVNIQTAGTDVNLSWAAITNAVSYKISVADDPYGTFTPLVTTANTSYTVVSPTASKKFYKVVASTDAPTARIAEFPPTRAEQILIDERNARDKK